jgi:hypothetical protein
MSLPLTLPPVINLVIYLTIVMGMVAVAVALDRWLAVAVLRPTTRQRPHLAAGPSGDNAPAVLPAPALHPGSARRQRALPIPALLSLLAARERTALWTIVGGALALRVLLPESFPNFLTRDELARVSEALRINSGTIKAGSPP